MKIENRISYLSKTPKVSLPHPITAIVTHSKKVIPNSVFVALKGKHTDGHLHLKEAIQRGATALIIEDQKYLTQLNFKGLTCIINNTRKLLPLLLNEFYDFPSHKMFCVAITGTNGKTTVSHLLAFLFSHFGWKAGLIGTLSQEIIAPQSRQDSGMDLRLRENESKPLPHLTTPSATDLYSLVNKCYQNEAQALVMEASSIGLDQRRVDGVDFNLAIWTNLTPDHLDYHPSMEAYFQSKKILFDNPNKHFMAILNFDDPYGLKLASLIKTKYLSYGTKNASFTWKILSTNLSGTLFELTYPKQFASPVNSSMAKETPKKTSKQNKQDSKIDSSLHWDDNPHEKIKVHSPLLGSHNISNAVAAIAAASGAGFPIEKAAKALSQFSGIKGRMERVPTSHSNSFIFIDYAHTPDALKKTLSFLNQHKKNKQLICVFGCGGDRDKQKRSLMGAIAEKYSDKIILTSDNPRTEDPKNIIQDILKGIASKNKVTSEPDRKLAIHQALKHYKNNIILLAGKGHEQYQIIGKQRNIFNEQAIIKNFFLTYS